MPVPVSPMAGAALMLSLLMVSVAVLSPSEEGENATVMVQLLPAASVARQLVVEVKSPEPVMAKPVRVRVPWPVFLRVMIWVVAGEDTIWLPNASDPGVAEATGSWKV